MSISVRSSLASATIGGSLALGMPGALDAEPLALASQAAPATPATCANALARRRRA